MKLAAAEYSSDTNLRRDIGEAGDEHDGDAFFLDLFADRSAATSASSSCGG
jgi:hypothetical protein